MLLGICNRLVALFAPLLVKVCSNLLILFATLGHLLFSKSFDSIIYKPRSRLALIEATGGRCFLLFKVERGVVSQDEDDDAVAEDDEFVL